MSSLLGGNVGAVHLSHGRTSAAPSPRFAAVCLCTRWLLPEFQLSDAADVSGNEGLIPAELSPGLRLPLGYHRERLSGKKEQGGFEARFAVTHHHPSPPLLGTKLLYISEILAAPGIRPLLRVEKIARSLSLIKVLSTAPLSKPVSASLPSLRAHSSGASDDLTV